MAYKLTLQDLISTMDKNIGDALSYDMRKLDLDKRPHVLDISKNSLKFASNIIPDNIEELYKIFLAVVSNNARISCNNIANIPRKLPGVVYVITPGILVGSSYDVIQKFISKVVRDPLLINTAYGITRTEKDVLNKKGIPTGDVTVSEVSRLDIGHIPTKGSDYFVSPAQQKIATILDLVAVNSNTNSRVTTLINSALDEIEGIQAKIDYEFRKYSDQVGLEGILGKVYVSVTLHSPYRNQREFGDQETAIFNKFKFNLISILAKKELVEKYIAYSSSNTIIEDIAQTIASIIGKNKKLAGHIPHKKTTYTANLRKGTAPTPKQQAVKVKVPAIRTTQSQFYSLANLQMLINTHLQSVISANMGDGSSKSVLNLRTGRLAASAKVERMSQSREGMITAFYSYMKNPYQTFESGFAQGRPKSRDPKLLIAGSIREIAATRASNILRAVSI